MKMSHEAYHFDTLKIRAGYNPAEHNQSVAVPIYQTASYDLGGPERAEKIFSFAEAGWLYTRVNNPTVAAISYTLLNIAAGGGLCVFIWF